MEGDWRERVDATRTSLPSLRVESHWEYDGRHVLVCKEFNIESFSSVLHFNISRKNRESSISPNRWRIPWSSWYLNRLQWRSFASVGVVTLSVVRKILVCLLSALHYLHEESPLAPLIHGHLQLSLWRNHKQMPQHPVCSQWWKCSSWGLRVDVSRNGHCELWLSRQSEKG